MRIALPLPAQIACTLICALVLVACSSQDTPERIVPDAGSDSGGGGAPPDPQPLSIVTWNVHNLVDDRHDGAPQEWVEDTAEWNAHRQAVGVVLANLDADIVALQEVEHLGVLDELNTEELGGRYPYRELVDANDPRGIDVGLLSKVALGSVVTHKDDEFTREGETAPTYQYSRDCLEVHLQFNSRSLVLLLVHYKAKENDNPAKRLAEAQHTRAIADGIIAASPTTGALIIGDFNDVPGSLPYDWTIGLEPPHWSNAADHVTAGDRWTFDYEGSHELVDQQIASPTLGPLVDGASAEIWHTAEVTAASDHAPLLATYQVQ